MYIVGINGHVYFLYCDLDFSLLAQTDQKQGQNIYKDIIMTACITAMALLILFIPVMILHIISIDQERHTMPMQPIQ